MAEDQPTTPHQAAASPKPDTASDTVTVKDTYGNLATMPKAQFQSGQARGYSLASDKEVDAWNNAIEYGGAGNALKAAGAAALRAPTFGGSDWALTKTGLVSPETLKNLEEYQPGASFVGGGLGLIGSAIATGGGSLAARGAAEVGGEIAAKSGLSKMAQFIPSNLFSKGLEKATEAAGKGIALVANPALRPVTNKVLTGVSHLAGSAIEGSAFGGGSWVTEQALGDPDEHGESLLQHLGYGALFGAGAGAAFGLGKGLVKGAIGKGKDIVSGAINKGVESDAIKAVDDAANEAGIVNKTPLGAAEEASQFGGASPPTEGGLRATLGDVLTPEGHEMLTEGMSKLDPNAERTLSAARNLGVTAHDFMLAKDLTPGKISDMVANSGNTIGQKYAQSLRNDLSKVDSVVMKDILHGGEEEMSKGQMAQELRQVVGDKYKKMAENSQEAYRLLDEANLNKPIPVAPQVAKGLADDIRALSKSHKFTEEEAAVANHVAKGIESGTTDLEDLQKWKTTVGRQTDTVPFASEKIGEVLDTFESKQVRNFAETMPDSAQKAEILGRLDLADKASSLYAPFITKLQRFAPILGVKEFRGLGDMLRKLSNPNYGAEKILDNLLKKSKGNAEFAQFLKEDMPEFLDVLGRAKKAEIYAKGMGGGDKFKSRTALNNILLDEKMSPEQRALFFTPEEISKLKDAKTYLDRFSATSNFNPSGTSGAQSYQGLLAHPLATGVAMALGNLKDLAALKVMRSHIPGVSYAKVGQLAAIERASNLARQRIVSTAKNVFEAVQKSTEIQTGEAGAGKKIEGSLEKKLEGYTGSQLSPKSEPTKKKDDAIADIESVRQMANSPEALLARIEKITQGLYDNAPNISGSFQQSMVRATQFLHSQVPTLPEPLPMAAKPVMNQAAIEKFQRALGAVHDPVEVMRKIRTGGLTREEVMAVQQVYPKLYQQMVGQLTQQMVDYQAKKDKPPLPYQTKLGLSKFLGQPLDHSMLPQTIVSNQIALAGMAAKKEAQQQQAQSTPVRASQKGLGSLTQSSQMLTPMQATAQRQKIH